MYNISLFLQKISIHSLVKRETFGFLRFRFIVADFNPLPRKEGDVGTSTGIIPAMHFNPLPRKEGDGTPNFGYNVVNDFNPLPRKEGDRKLL